MRLLLDTHALIWWLLGDSALSAAAKASITDDDNEVLVSAASAWEISTKYRIGKLPKVAFFATDIAGAVASQGFGELPVTVRDAERAGLLPGPHRDPFDRMLIAQALALNLGLVSNETTFDRYGVHRIW
ncbi:MAG: type II toxin-antitoxin system VapC family toxin [Stellaceae bacterium]